MRAEIRFLRLLRFNLHLKRHQNAMHYLFCGLLACNSALFCVYVWKLFVGYQHFGINEKRVWFDGPRRGAGETRKSVNNPTMKKRMRRARTDRQLTWRFFKAASKGRKVKLNVVHIILTSSSPNKLVARWANTTHSNTLAFYGLRQQQER